MNKHLHRIIFNTARGQRMVVAETAASHGSAAAGETAGSAAIAWWLMTSLSAIAAGVLGVCAPGWAQIVADPHAPGNQRPTVLLAPNGVPVVNIQTPSAAGVSRNTYNQFDVNAAGAILNNSRSNVQSQQGGWVQANPWLATGAARVILNEVNSSNPSRLNGYVEVAGQRAEVIIANPAGIQVNGGGFINASGVTLTTGTPVMNNGNLDAFLVRGGQVSVDGLGLDASTADATRILARAVQVNAGIWAKDLTVVTGANEVKALSAGSDASASRIDGTGVAPRFALDVAAVGGMYAGKIYLVGTEAGLGVNNRGTLAAQKGAWTLTTEGQLINTGRIQAQGDLTVHAAGSIENTGASAVMSAQGNTAVQSFGSIANTTGATLTAAGTLTAATQGTLDNTASTLAANGAIQITAAADVLNNRGSLVSMQSDIAVDAARIDNTDGTALAHGNVTLHASQRVDNTNGTLSAGQQLAVRDSGAARALAISNAGGLAEAGQAVTLHAGSLTGNGTLQSAGDLNIDLAGNFESAADLRAGGNAALVVGGTFTNRAKVQAGQAATVKATQINNTAAGEIAGQTRTAVEATGSVINRGLLDGAQTRIDAASLTNLGTGRIYGDHVAIGAGTFLNDTETLNGERKDAVVAARERLDIGVGTLINRENALIFSAGTGADALNIGGALDAAGHATGQANLVHNASATIESMGGLSIAAAQIKNTNEHFSTTVAAVGGPTALKYIQPEGSDTKVLASNFIWEGWSRAGQYRYNTAPPIDSSGVLGKSPVPRVGEEDCVGDEPNEVCTRLPGADYLTSNPAWAYFGVLAPEPEPAAPTLAKPVAPAESGAASCTAGAGYNAPACTAYNNAVAQYESSKATYDAAWTRYASDRSAWQAESEARYETLDTRIDAYNQGFAANVVRAWTEFNVTRTEYETQVVSSAPGQILSAGDMRLTGGELLNDKSRIIAGGTLTGALADALSIEAEGQHVVREQGTSESTWSTWRGGVKRYHQRDWGGQVAYLPGDEVKTIILPVAAKLQNTLPTGTLTQITDQASAGAVSAPDQSGTAQGLPSNSLFRQNPAANASYLIETDPRFADYRQWLGSDYLLSALGSDPATVQKRLGDGFYEQRLVREQVAQLTGKRFLEGFGSDEAQYQALMDAGVTVAKGWNLIPGVALTAEQMAALTSDIVWLVTKEVALADGSRQSVLTPQIYLRPREGDLAPTGTLLAAQRIDLNLSGTLTNAGTIAGRTVVNINATTIDNIRGMISGQKVVAQATEDIHLTGGRISAQDGLSVQAGRNLNIASTTQTTGNESGASSFSRTAIDRVAGLYVSGEAGVLIASAGNNIDIVAGVISNAGTGGTYLQAGGDLNLGTVKTALQENNVRDAKNYLTGGRTEEVGSQIAGGGDVVLAAAGNIQARAAHVQAAEALVARAGGDITIEAGEATSNYGMGYERKGGGMLSKRTTTVRESAESTSAVGSSFNGGTLDIQAGQDIAVRGSDLNAQQQAYVAAGRDLTIESTEQSESGSSFAQTKKSGFSASSKGIGYGKSNQSTDSRYQSVTQAGSNVTGADVVLQAGQDVAIRASTVVADEDVNIVTGRNVAIVAGTNSTESDQASRSSGTFLGMAPSTGKSVTLFSNTKSTQDGHRTATTAASSTVGSLGGNVAIQAGQGYTQTGSDVLTQQGNIAILAQTVDINEARERSTDAQRQTSKSTTLGAAPRNALIDAVMAVKGTGDMAKATAQTSNGRVQAIGAAATALNGYNTYNQVQQAMADPTKVSIEFTLGTSKSESSSQQTSDLGRGSHLAAGGDVSIVARGAGTASDIHVGGSDIRAGRNLLLAADGDITLESSQDLGTLNSQNKSSGASIGVAISFGSSTGISFSASANQARGKANGDDAIQQNTHVTAGRAIQIQSGADTTLAGATIVAPTVKADIGGNLLIESRQDTSTYTSAQKSSGMGVSLCIPPICYGASSVSGSVGKQNVDSYYRSVTEQSGIRAGDGGFQVSVGGNTTLTGGAITSSDLAVQEGLNSFATGGTLTTTDIQNRADYKGEGFSVNVTVAGGGKDKPPEGHERRTQATPPTNGGSAGIAEDKGSGSSVTTASISGIAGNTAMRTGDAEAGLTPIFDRDAVQREIDAQIKITAEFGKLASKAVGDLAGAKADDLRNQAKTESDPDKRQAMLDDAARWDEGGAYRSLAHAVIGGLTGGASGAAGAGAAALSADKINQAMAGLPDGVRNAVGAAIATGIGAAAGGVAGAATAFNEDLNNRQLHPSEKELAKKLAARSGGKYTLEQIEEQMRLMGNVAFGELPNTTTILTNIQSIQDSISQDPNMPKTAYENTVAEVVGHYDADIQQYIIANTKSDAGWIPGGSPYDMSSSKIPGSWASGVAISPASSRCANGDLACLSGVGVQQNPSLTPAQQKAIGQYFGQVSTDYQRAAALATATGNIPATGSFEIAAAIAGLLEQAFLPSSGKVFVDSAIDSAVDIFSKSSGIPKIIVFEVVEREIKPRFDAVRSSIDNVMGEK